MKHIEDETHNHQLQRNEYICKVFKGDHAVNL